MTSPAHATAANHNDSNAIRLLALCGSLRRASLNAMLLRATQRVAPHSVRISLYPSLGDLPPFNPDIEDIESEAVIRLRDAIMDNDGLIIASPEYARGVSGVMKNALDWMVGNESFINKPVMLLNASPRAHHALDALRLTLQTMSATVVDEAHVAVQFMGTKLDEDGIVSDSKIAESLRKSLIVFAQAIAIRRVSAATLASPVFPIVPMP
jgi:chromate reductase